MKLIIDIPERYYEFCRECVFNRTDTVDQNIIANGTPYNERPKGEWILKETDYDDGGNNLYECNKCHHSDIHSGSIEVPYCWHCGTDMRGDKE